MKTRLFFASLAVLWTAGLNAFPQSTNLHYFAAITAGLDRKVELSVTGGVPFSFRNYYDLFPIETSEDLVHWRSWLTVLRTNRVVGAIDVQDSNAIASGKRFYRTPTNQLITPIPQPGGPYPVGTVSRVFTDLSRTNRYHIATNSSFIVQFWYPASNEATELPAPYLDPKAAAVWASYYSQVGLDANLALFKSAVSSARSGPPMATNQIPFPIVIFSHGYQCVRTMDTEVMISLASYGFITAAIDHFDAWVSVLPPGTVVRGNAPNLPIPAAQDSLGIQSRTRDVTFLLDELTRLNQQDDLLRNRLDLEHVGIFGHSYGGATVADACAADRRLKAGLSLDGGGHTNLLGLTIEQPFLIASGDDANPTMQPYRADYRTLFNQLGHDAFWFRLRSSEHFDFVESPWFANSPNPTKLRFARILRTYALSFFNKYLKGQDDHFLDGPPADWPEIDVFLKK